jgi:hypothetical protein
VPKRAERLGDRIQDVSGIPVSDNVNFDLLTEEPDSFTESVRSTTDSHPRRTTVKSTSLRIFSLLTIALLLSAGALSTAAQDRLSDKDVANMMNNLKNDAKNFRGVWNHALSKSTIRKTSREKDARNLATQFQNQTEGMLRQFQSNKTADTSLPAVQQTARSIEQVKSDVSLGPVVDQQWTKIRTELDQISQAFKLPSN